ncbi:aspartate 1-decarboxylase [Ignavibacteria bacterium]|nr:aspartate 1-decarboxylase [Bacteroidota bacterium]MCZ2131826.1 aspartate 1-decarboxylase [Bacteroidota bacterium]
MQLTIFKSKIHRATLTETDLRYEGSITIDEDLMEAADLLRYEKVLVVNNNNGDRFETYVIPGERGSGDICLNGAAARKGQIGDQVIIISFAQMTPEEARNYRPTAVMVDRRNAVKDISRSVEAYTLYEN